MAIKKNVLVLLVLMGMVVLPGCEWPRWGKSRSPKPASATGLGHVNLGKTFDQPAVTIAAPAKHKPFDNLEITEMAAFDRVGKLCTLDFSLGKNQFGPWMRITAKATGAYRDLTITAKIRYQNKNYKLIAVFTRPTSDQPWKRKSIDLREITVR